MVDVVRIQNQVKESKIFEAPWKDWTNMTQANYERWVGKWVERDVKWQEMYESLQKTEISEWSKVMMYGLQAVQLWGLKEQYKTQKEIAKMQRDLIDRQIKLAEKGREDYEQLYRPTEQNQINDVNRYFQSPYQPDYTTMAGRMANAAKAQFIKAEEQIMRCSSAFCSGATRAKLAQLRIASAQAQADGANAGILFENQKKQSRDDIWWNRRAAVVTLGQNVKTNTMASLSGLASALNSDPGAAFGQMLNGVGRLIGNVQGDMMQQGGIFGNKDPKQRPAVDQNGLQASYSNDLYRPPTKGGNDPNWAGPNISRNTDNKGTA